LLIDGKKEKQRKRSFHMKLASIAKDREIEVSGGDGSPDKEVSVSSSTLDKLKAGLRLVENRSNIIAQKWEDKQKNAAKLVMCMGKSCGKTFKNVSGLKAHWRSKVGKECASNGKFEEVPDVDITLEDRLLPGEDAKAALIGRGQEAAKRARDEVYGCQSKMTSPNTVTAEALMKSSTGTMLDRAMRQMSDIELQRFVAMRFDSLNSIKRVYAMVEMKKRGLSMTA
jgi:hypothetical protein